MNPTNKTKQSSSKTPSVRILLTCLGGRYSLGIIKALKESTKPKMEIIGADIIPDVIPKHFVDSFYTIPRGSDSNYISEVLRICKKERIDIIIPGADEEVIALSTAKEIFNKRGIICSVDTIHNINLVSDKFDLYNFLAKNYLFKPQYKLLQKAGDIDDVADYFGYPKSKFVVKPRRSRGARNVWIIGEDSESSSTREFRNYFKNHSEDLLDYVAVEFLPGPAYDVDVIAKDGEPICIVPRRRLWKNKLSASNEGCRVENNKKLISLVADIVRLLKLNNAYDFDCGSLDNSEHAIYEINPRFSGAVAASLGAGVNLPVMLVKLLKGLSLSNKNITFDVSMFPVSEMVFLKKGKLYYADKNRE